MRGIPSTGHAFAITWNMEGRAGTYWCLFGTLIPVGMPAWAPVDPLLPPASSGGPEKHARHEIVDAVLYLVRTGCA
jgi:hypothetical protein